MFRSHHRPLSVALTFAAAGGLAAALSLAPNASASSTAHTTTTSAAKGHVIRMGDGQLGVLRVTTLSTSGGVNVSEISVTPETAANPQGRLKPDAVTEGEDECLVDTDVNLNASTGIITGYAAVTSCSPPASLCTSHATIQVQDPRDPDLGWGTVDSSVKTEGCTFADRAVASSTCHSDVDVWNYRTQGLYEITWDDGTESGPQYRYDGTDNRGWLC